MKTRIAISVITTLFLIGAAWAVSQDSAATDPDTDSDRVVRASRVIGMSVYNARDEYLGEIEDLVLDRQDGDLAYAVLNYGGVLGIGGKYIAVPFDEFQLDIEARQLRLETTPAALDAMTGFEWSRAWPAEADWGDDSDHS